MAPELFEEITAQGYVIRRTDNWSIEVWPMLYNWRVVLVPPGPPSTVWKGYCYFGTEVGTMARAILAANAWEDPEHTDPAGFDKRAF